MTGIFTKEVSVPVMEFDPSQDKSVPKAKKRVFTFKELDEYDQDQQKFHFKLNAVFEAAIGQSDEKVGSEKHEIVINPDGVHELVIKFINTCIITTDDKGNEIPERINDKRDLLQNSRALYTLGMWLMNEKFVPFFLQFRES